MDTKTLQSKLPSIPGFTISVWDRVPGKERVYLRLNNKRNGGAAWNGGVGREDYLDLATMTWREKTGWAGAATREAYWRQVGEAQEQIVAAVEAWRGGVQAVAQ